MAKTSKRKSNGDAVSNEIIEESTQTVDQKDSYAKRMLKGLKPASVYFAIYFITLTLSELFIRYHISETVSGQNLFFLFFVPAEALFFTALTGFFKSLGNKINLPIVLTVIGVYYCVQYVYFKIFGSLFSVSMMKMGGTAVGNFFWAMKEILIGSIVSIFIFLAPTIASVFLGFFKEIKYKGYPLLLHLLIMLAAVGFWFLGLQGIKLGGTDRTSAYYVFHNSASDTDTTASHIGTLTTFIVEAGAYYFGIDVPTEADVFVAVDQNALSLSKEPTPKKDTAADTTADVVEEVVTPEGGEALFAEAVFDDGKQCFGANTSVPEGYADPIADFGFVFADGDVACAVRQVADAADGFVGFFPYDGPHSFTMEDGADEL